MKITYKYALILLTISFTYNLLWASPQTDFVEKKYPGLLIKLYKKAYRLDDNVMNNLYQHFDGLIKKETTFYKTIKQLYKLDKKLPATAFKALYLALPKTKKSAVKKVLFLAHKPIKEDKSCIKVIYTYFTEVKVNKHIYAVVCRKDDKLVFDGITLGLRLILDHLLKQTAKGHSLKFSENLYPVSKFDKSKFSSQFRNIFRSTYLIENYPHRPTILTSSKKGTGLFISPNGHLLTNMHLFIDKLTEKGLIEKVKVGGLNFYKRTSEKIPQGEEGTLKWIYLKHEKRKNIFERLGWPKIIYIGNGYRIGDGDHTNFLYKMGEWASGYPKEKLKKIRAFHRSHSEDVIILKFNLGDKKAPFVRLSNKSAKKNERTYLVGYPGDFKRIYSGLDIEEGNLYITYGKARKSHVYTPFGNYCYQIMERKEARQLYKRMDFSFLTPSMLLTDNDKFYGMSGGGLFNRRGDLLGILKGGLDSYIYLGVGHYVKSSWIVSQYRKFKRK